MASLGTKVSPSPACPPESAVDFNFARRSASVMAHPFARRRWLFVTADFAWIASGALLAIALRFDPSLRATHLAPTLASHLSISLLYAVLIVLLCHSQNLYSLDRPLSRYHEFANIFKSICLATILLGGSLFVSGVKSASRLVVVVIAVYSLVTMVGWRWFRRWSLGKAVADGLSCHNAIIVGTDPMAVALASHLNAHRELGFIVVGHLGPAVPFLAEDDQPVPAKILGAASDLKKLCRSHFADEVIVCTHHRPTVIQAITDARECGLGVRVIPDLFDGAALGSHLHYLGDFPSLAVVNRTVPAISMKFKRLLDVVVSGLALAFLSPVLLALALIVKFTSKGPVFYKSARVGRKGRPFSCYKFRTMVADAEELKAKLHHLNERDGVLFKIANDPRITSIGRFMRKYSLDELAQLWNVLKGDMSLVGPRPPLTSEVKQYASDYLRRLEAAPGITGLWQVEARNHPSFDRYISLDLYYIENWSLGLDIQILFRTIAVVFAGTGS